MERKCLEYVPSIYFHCSNKFFLCYYINNLVEFVVLEKCANLLNMVNFIGSIFTKSQK